MILALQEEEEVGDPDIRARGLPKEMRFNLKDE